jgi:Fe2+ or Zn2+ uptake regulation protein
MVHSFDTEIAKEVGVNAAILLHNIFFWVEKNRANEVHFHDGYYWTYNSNNAFQELFPYMTGGQIRTAIDKLVESGFIIKGNYNTNPYDKTCWYAVTEHYHLFCRTDRVVNENTSTSNTEQMNITNNKTQLKNTYNKQPVQGSTSSSKLFSTPKNTSSEKISDKADKWISAKEKIIAEYQFSSEIDTALWEFLQSLAEVNSLISDITFRAQLDKLADKVNDNDNRLEVIKKTITRGWRSLDYAIEETIKGKHPSFDTSEPGAYKPREKDWQKKYEGQPTF